MLQLSITECDWDVGFFLKLGRDLVSLDDVIAYPDTETERPCAGYHCVWPLSGLVDEFVVSDVLREILEVLRFRFDPTGTQDVLFLQEKVVLRGTNGIVVLPENVKLFSSATDVVSYSAGTGKWKVYAFSSEEIVCYLYAIHVEDLYHQLSVRGSGDSSHSWEFSFCEEKITWKGGEIVLSLLYDEIAKISSVLGDWFDKHIQSSFDNEGGIETVTVNLWDQDVQHVFDGNEYVGLPAKRLIPEEVRWLMWEKIKDSLDLNQDDESIEAWMIDPKDTTQIRVIHVQAELNVNEIPSDSVVIFPDPELNDLDFVPFLFDRKEVKVEWEDLNDVEKVLVNVTSDNMYWHLWYQIKTGRPLTQETQDLLDRLRRWSTQLEDKGERILSPCVRAYLQRDAHVA